MPTIGRNYNGPLHNYTDMCDYCGVFYHRTDLTGPDADGWLRCPECRSGLTLTELADIAAANVGEIQPIEGKKREGV